MWVEEVHVWHLDQHCRCLLRFDSLDVVSSLLCSMCEAHEDISCTVSGCACVDIFYSLALVIL